jgi:hypothetical protein
LTATWLVTEDEVVAGQIEGAMFGLASSVQADIFEPQLLLRVSRRICHDVGDLVGLSTLGCRVFGVWNGVERGSAQR